MIGLEQIYISLPKQEQTILSCSLEASEYYLLDVYTLLAVAKTEGGKPNLKVKNTNGTFDLGYMQFNTGYLKNLASYGIKELHVLGNDCYSFKLAAWRIKKHLLTDKGDYWQKVANYHSYTPKYNKIYQEKLAKNYAYWQKKLPDLEKILSSNKNKQVKSVQPQTANFVVTTQTSKNKQTLHTNTSQQHYIPRQIYIPKENPGINTGIKKF